jgi:two-component system sensor histidine kinase AlgZ
LQLLTEKLIDIAAIVQPILIASLLLLAALSPWLRRLAYWPAVATLIALELAVSTVFYYLGQGVFANIGALERYWLFTLMMTGVLIGYFDLRGRALSPALTEARLQALQARIRPHFLFNSINAVLSVIRQNPSRMGHRRYAARCLAAAADGAAAAGKRGLSRH